MRVVIQRAPDLPGAGLFPIAGQPLIARQLQWMRALGYQDIAVEIGPDAASMEMARGLKEESALGVEVTLVMAGRHLTPREIARRAGFPEDAPVVALPSTVVGGGGLFSPAQGGDPGGASISIQLQPPEALAGRFQGGCLRVLSAAGTTEETVDGPGWAVSVQSYADALALGMAVLDGRVSSNPDDGAGILIHGAERSPGVWAARGAVIEPGAVLSMAVVRDGTIVGRKVELSRVILEPHGITRLSNGERTEVGDALVLGARSPVPGPALWARMLALAVLAVLAPALALAWVCAGLVGRASVRRVQGFSGRRPITLLEGSTGVGLLDALPRLVDVVRGTRFLVGVSAWGGPRPAGASSELFAEALAVPCGLLSVEDALTPPDTDAATRLRVRLWYGFEKKASVDGLMLLRRAGRAVGLGAAARPARRTLRAAE